MLVLFIQKRARNERKQNGLRMTVLYPYDKLRRRDSSAEAHNPKSIYYSCALWFATKKEKDVKIHENKINQSLSSWIFFLNFFHQFIWIEWWAFRQSQINILAVIYWDEFVDYFYVEGNIWIFFLTFQYLYISRETNHYMNPPTKKSD